ncbi:hypothetical protein [Vampirovibrio sp.]|uniref:hypothetical protein n=1 Tax=Vampirovibrio sp. TaxID=2717857 RepID=UPI003593B5A1
MNLKRNFWIRLVLLCLATLTLAFSGVTELSNALAAPAMSGTQQTQSVQILENTLFAIQYDQDPLEKRVGRLEETVFGQAQSGLLTARIDKLKTALSPSTLGPLSAKAEQKVVTKPLKANKTSGNTSNKTSANNKPVSPNNTSAQTTPTTQQALPAPEESDYPTISQMEQKLFKQTYIKEDITLRLSRLEKEVFKVPQTGDLANRMDNLRLVVLGDTGSTPQSVASYAMPNNTPNSAYIPSPGPNQAYTPPQYGQNGMGGYYPTQAPYGTSGNGYNQAGGSAYPGSQVASGDPFYNGNPQAYGQPVPGNYQPSSYPPNNSGDYQASYQPGTNPAGMMPNGQVSPDMLAAMDEVEKQVIGHTFPSEPMNARLDRVETKVFHTTSPELAPQDRMQRVIAVASAGGAPSSPQAKAKSTFQSILPIILTILPLILL